VTEATEAETTEIVVAATATATVITFADETAP
jgi:hypothetical protein